MGCARRYRPSWDTVFAEAHLKAGTVLPLDTDHEERAIYVIAGEIEIAGDRHGPERLLVLKPGDRIDVKATADARIVVVGGAAMDGPRHIWWNFVSSRKERIEAAKADWKAGRFDARPRRCHRIHSAAGIVSWRQQRTFCPPFNMRGRSPPRWTDPAWPRQESPKGRYPRKSLYPYRAN